MIKVLIVDDQKTVQEVLRSYLEEDTSLEVVNCANNGQEALDIIETNRPHIVLMDIEMPILDGLTATRIISEKYVDTNVLILSVHDEDAYLNTALQVGAKGYLLKNTPARELLNAIHSAYKGYFQLGPGLLEKYLYKIGKSQINLQEIEQLKTILTEQSQILEGIKSKNRSNFSKNENSQDRDRLKEKFISLEQRLYSLGYRLDDANKKIRYLQQFCLMLAIALVFLLLVFGFSQL
ncbi:MAG: response regulator transcription factor [Pleurocapsa sp.]